MSRTASTKVLAHGVVTLNPVVFCSRWTKHKTVWQEDLAKRAGVDRIHCARFQVNQYGSEDIISTCALFVVDIDSPQQEVTVPMIGSSGVDAMLTTDDFPELGPIWLQHYQACRCTISRVVVALLVSVDRWELTCGCGSSYGQNRCRAELYKS